MAMTQKPNVTVIAGPTASGKSSLAQQIARKSGGIIVNADALQVYNCWRILTARPSEAEENEFPHFLYGHVTATDRYSVGDWLRDVKEILEATDKSIIIVGGTGLYLSMLFNGLPEIPEVAIEVRKEGNALRAQFGGSQFRSVLELYDPETLSFIDLANPMRLQRAWEVFVSTGKGLSYWQKQSSEPLLDKIKCETLVLNVDPQELRNRISNRFDQMRATGALDECRTVLANGWDPTRPSAKALGAKEIIAHLQGTLTKDEASSLAIFATCQYAKRQRTWLRSRMRDWTWISA